MLMLVKPLRRLEHAEHSSIEWSRKQPEGSKIRCIPADRSVPKGVETCLAVPGRGSAPSVRSRCRRDQVSELPAPQSRARSRATIMIIGSCERPGGQRWCEGRSRALRLNGGVTATASESTQVRASRSKRVPSGRACGGTPGSVFGSRWADRARTGCSDFRSPSAYGREAGLPARMRARVILDIRDRRAARAAGCEGHRVLGRLLGGRGGLREGWSERFTPVIANREPAPRQVLLAQAKGSRSCVGPDLHPILPERASPGTPSAMGATPVPPKTVLSGSTGSGGRHVHGRAGGARV
jgi:hypothetical protein